MKQLQERLQATPDQLAHNTEPTRLSGARLGWAPEQPQSPELRQAIAALLGQASQGHEMLQGAGLSPEQLQLLSNLIKQGKLSYESQDWRQAGLAGDKASHLSKALLRQAP